MADGVYPWVFGHSKQLSLNKFFDPTTPSMRKVDNGEKKKKKKEKKEEKKKKKEEEKQKDEKSRKI